MPTVQITVPINGNKNEMDGWIENISQHIDAGNTIEFVDENNADCNISRLQMDTAGSVCIWGVGYAESSAQLIALTAGVFHTIGGIHGIRADLTGASKGIHVKI